MEHPKQIKSKNECMEVVVFPEKKLTAGMYEKLQAYGIRGEDIHYFIVSDMNLDSAFEEGYVLVGRGQLVVVTQVSKNKEKKVLTFGGYAKECLPTEDGEYKVKIFELEKLTNLEVVRNVSGGTLVGTYNGEDERIAAFSNSKLGDFARLQRDFEELKTGKLLQSETSEYLGQHECCPNCGTVYPDQERKICPKCLDKRSIFVRIISYFSPYKGKIAVMFFCYIATACINMLWPYLCGTILYDQVLAKNETLLELYHIPAGRFTILLFGLVVVMVLTKVCIHSMQVIQAVIAAKIVPEVVMKLKTSVFESMGRLSVSFYNSRQTGSLMTRVLNDANQVTNFFINGIPPLITNSFTIIFTCIVMIKMNWKLAIASLVLLPLLSVISYRLLPRLWYFYGKRHRANRSLNGQINDNITGARVVKAFGQEETELERFGKYNKRVRNAEMSLVKFDNAFYALYASVQNIAYFMVWGIGSIFVLSGTNMELGILMTFVGYVNQLNGPLEFMSHIFRMWAESMNSAQRIFEIMDAVPDILELPNPIRNQEMKGELTLSNVTFGYDKNKPVLKDISFHIEAGKMLGIVGRSGAGKSTLVNLISRLYDPQEGRITIDGIDIKDMAFEDVRGNIAMVSQETYVFMGSVADNIAYAKPKATKEEIIRAAKLASAHDFICKMPDGYDTFIGSSGRSLSGGERQRISIARAILADPKILILDEATAAVDTETEQAIQSSLEQLVKGRTTISIAHRLSTLKNADQLVVIDEGRITETGTHEELIAQEGTYYMLMELQTKALAMRGIE